MQALSGPSSETCTTTHVEHSTSSDVDDEEKQFSHISPSSSLIVSSAEGGQKEVQVSQLTSKSVPRRSQHSLRSTHAGGWSSLPKPQLQGKGARRGH